MYRHNWTDNKIINELRRSARVTQTTKSKHHFFVPTKDVKSILSDKFMEDINHQAGLPTEKLLENINSAFFLHSVVNVFENLRFIKFNVSSNKNYTRKRGDTITFDYKILHARIDLPELCKTKKELRAYQNLLREIKFWHYDKFRPATYIEVSSRDLITQLQIHEGTNPEFVKEYGAHITNLLNYIDVKLETDNTTIHLIVLE
jgi:hypothetical protein